MTGAPKTLSLDSREWNALLAHNAIELAQFFQRQPVPDAGTYKQIVQHMERMQQILPGWLASAPAAAQGAGKAPAGPAAAPHTNGASEPVKRRGGWPKGKKRGTPRAEVVQ